MIFNKGMLSRQINMISFQAFVVFSEPVYSNSTWESFIHFSSAFEKTWTTELCWLLGFVFGFLVLAAIHLSSGDNTKPFYELSGSESSSELSSRTNTIFYKVK